MKDVRRTLENGDLVVTGRLIDASNATLLAECNFQESKVKCIYKPVAGERPLWDFPDGTLANREYAAFLVSELLGFNIVPLTILRDGPFGVGMVQEWIDIDEGLDLANFFGTDDAQLRKMALFDAVINNTDRKIGHLLPDTTGSLFGCDHGVTFHEENKLRTVLWQWAGDSLSDQEIASLSILVEEIKGNSKDQLLVLITVKEYNALIQRIQDLLRTKKFPLPNPEWPAIPWPAF
jgi:hypothetical protein